MKLNKLVSKSIIAIALLGTTLGGAFSSINASANDDSNNVNSSSNNNPTSTTTEKVEHNTLTLDSVPNFDFQNQNGDNGGSLKLSNDGTLKVSDYRQSDDPNIGNNKPNGWTLGVSANSVDQHTSDENNNWTLHLNQNNLNVPNGNVPKADTQGITGTDLNTTDSNGANNRNIINKGGYGLTSLTYHAGQDQALLYIPNVHPDTYKMNINWTLGTTMNGTQEN